MFWSCPCGIHRWPRILYCAGHLERKDLLVLNAELCSSSRPVRRAVYIDWLDLEFAFRLIHVWDYSWDQVMKEYWLNEVWWSLENAAGPGTTTGIRLVIWLTTKANQISVHFLVTDTQSRIFRVKRLETFNIQSRDHSNMTRVDTRQQMDRARREMPTSSTTIDKAAKK